MTDQHLWWQCRPALLLKDDDTSTAPEENDASVVDKVWKRMNDAERHRFHKFTCEGDRAPRTIEVIYQMRAALNREGVDD